MFLKVDFYFNFRHFQKDTLKLQPFHNYSTPLCQYCCLWCKVKAEEAETEKRLISFKFGIESVLHNVSTTKVIPCDCIHSCFALFCWVIPSCNVQLEENWRLCFCSCVRSVVLLCFFCGAQRIKLESGALLFSK